MTGCEGASGANTEGANPCNEALQMLVLDRDEQRHGETMTEYCLSSCVGAATMAQLWVTIGTATTRIPPESSSSSRH
jgi:hypothetical protein